MSDRLYLSCWVRGYSEQSLFRHFGKLVRVFPHSRMAASPTLLRIYAFEEQEPPLAEQAFAPPLDMEELLRIAREFAHADCCYQVDAWWDLWQHDGEWKIEPAVARLCGFGPAFERELGEHLRVEFGLESRFLPQPDLAGGARMAQSNLRSLLHLVQQLEETLDVEKRRLWSESGANFAERLASF